MGGNGQTDRRMDWWMDGFWVSGRMDGWMGGWVDGWMDGWMDGRMKGRMGGGQTEGRSDGWMVVGRTADGTDGSMDGWMDGRGVFSYSIVLFYSFHCRRLEPEPSWSGKFKMASAR